MRIAQSPNVSGVIKVREEEKVLGMMHKWFVFLSSFSGERGMHKVLQREVLASSVLLRYEP